MRANIPTTVIQVCGRLQVLGFMYWWQVQPSWGTDCMILAWASVEIVRYLYLALNVLGLAPHCLVWLRYSMFYLLYPLGVVGEMKVLYDTLPLMEGSQFLSVYLRGLLLVVYLPALAFQYSHMMKQRRAVLEKTKVN